MFVLDSHCDTPSQISRLRDLALDNDHAHVDFPKLARGGVDGAFFALYVPASKDSDPEAAWYDDTPFGVHILRVLEKKEITIDLYCFAPVLPEAGEDRKALAERIHGMMEMEYWKIENSR